MPASLIRIEKLPESDDITQWLNARSQRFSAGDILPLVYDELRRLAAQRMRQESPGKTLQPTALVHEAFVRLMASGAGEIWDNRGHFFAAAAESMRRILIEEARRKQTGKHGGGMQRIPFSEDFSSAAETDEEALLVLDVALQRLETEHPELAELVKLRYFAGLSVPEVATAMDLSERTVKRHWSYARAWLVREMATI
ncbi:sigma-70 family RNA polymerase sigma factor [bacterium]|nr:sigma-70 family RNA polymerase sigma factor [bacterium]